MPDTCFENKKWTFRDGIDPADPEYRKNLLKPVNIKTDLSMVKDKKRVAAVLNSTSFKEELEELIDTHLKAPDYSAINTSYLNADIFTQVTAKNSSSGGGLHKTDQNSVIPINDLKSGANTFYSRTERLLRCKLASVFRLLDLFVWNTSPGAHITARVSREKEHFLINPFGLLYHEITASSLLKIDSSGNLIDEGSTILGLRDDSWRLHSLVHAARPDIRVAIHLEISSTIAASVMELKLLPLCPEAMILGPIAYIDPVDLQTTDLSCDPIALRTRQRTMIAEALGPTSKILLVRGSGIFAMGETIDEAWHYATNAVTACETQMMLSSVGLENMHIPSIELVQETYEFWRTAELGGLSRREAAMAMRLTHAADQKRRKHMQQNAGKSASAEPNLESNVSQTPWRLGELEFEAMMRHLDNAGFRTGHLYRYATINQFDDIIYDKGASLPGSKGPSGDISRVASPTALSTMKGRISRTQSPAGKRSLSIASDTEDEIEVPPCNSSVAANIAYFFSDDEDPARTSGLSGDESDHGLRSNFTSLRRGQTVDPLLYKTPNRYTKRQFMIYDNATGRSEATRCWISDREAELLQSLNSGMAPPMPAHPLTPGAVPMGTTGGSPQPLSASISRGMGNKALLSQLGLSSLIQVSPNQFALQGENPNEFKDQQKMVKNKYYKDLNSSGPQSRLLDSLTMDEARRLRDETLVKALGPRLAAQVSRGGQSALSESGLVTCASRAIIEKNHRNKAIVYDGLYSHVNPFDKITDEDLEMYKHEIELKQKSATLDRDFGSMAIDNIEDDRRVYSEGEDISKAHSPATIISSDASGPEGETSTAPSAYYYENEKKRKKRFRFPFLSRIKDKSKQQQSTSK